MFPQLNMKLTFGNLDVKFGKQGNPTILKNFGEGGVGLGGALVGGDEREGGYHLLNVFYHQRAVIKNSIIQVLKGVEANKSVIPGLARVNTL